MMAHFNCSGCGDTLEDGQEVVAIIRGQVSSFDEAIIGYEEEAVLCTKCEEEVLPAFWADVNEIEGGINADGNNVPINRDIAAIQRKKDSV